MEDDIEALEEEFGRLLKEILEKGAGNGQIPWTYEDLHEKTRVTKETIENWENGDTTPQNRAWNRVFTVFMEKANDEEKILLARWRDCYHSIKANKKQTKSLEDKDPDDNRVPDTNYSDDGTTPRKVNPSFPSVKEHIDDASQAVSTKKRYERRLALVTVGSSMMILTVAGMSFWWGGSPTPPPPNTHTVELKLPSFELHKETIEVQESTDPITVKVKLSAKPKKKIVISAYSKPGTAEKGEDFYGFHKKLIFGPGEDEHLFDLKVLSDKKREDNEYFFIYFNNPISDKKPYQQRLKVLISDN